LYVGDGCGDGVWVGVCVGAGDGVGVAFRTFFGTGLAVARITGVGVPVGCCDCVFDVPLLANAKPGVEPPPEQAASEIAAAINDKESCVLHVSTSDASASSAGHYSNCDVPCFRSPRR